MVNKIYKTIEKCKICGSTLEEMLKFDPQYIATTFVKDNLSHPMSKEKVPMTVVKCNNNLCQLVQLKETVNPDLLYKDYFYRTGVNNTMKNDLRELVEDIYERVNPSRGEIVLDIGANDMTMLQMFPSFMRRIGIEPAKNINWQNVNNSVEIINDYFTKEIVLPKLNGKKAKVITSCACFYDFPNAIKAINDMKEMLEEDGIIVIQISSLLSTIKNNNWMDFCHEHVMYYSLHSFMNLILEQGLYLNDVKQNFVNGGSFRAYISKNNKNVSQSVFDMLKEEKEYKINEKDTYIILSNMIQETKDKVNDFIKDKNVIGLAASTKGNVILQALELDKNKIPFISDRNKNDKVGLKTLGTDILLISEEEAREKNPDVFLCLTFHFKEEILKREEEYINNGGKILFIMPYVYYVDKYGEHRL